MPTSTSKTPLYVSQISTNIKGENLVDIALGPRTLIVGPNGSRKSALIDAVRFATTATVNDINGRDLVADDGLLATLIGEGKELFARAVFSDGRQSQSTLTKGKKKSGPSLPIAVWHTDAVREALSGSPDTVRRFVLGMVESEINDQRVLAAVGEDYATLYSKTVEMTKGDTALQRLERVIDYSKKRARDLSKEADGLDGHARGVSNGLGADPSEAELLQAKVRYEAALEERGKSQIVPQKPVVNRRAVEIEVRLEALTDEWNRLTANAERIDAEAASITKKLQALGPMSEEDARIPQKIKRIEALAVVARWFPERKLDTCMVCSHKLSEASYAYLKDLANEADGAVEDLKAENNKAAMRAQLNMSMATLVSDSAKTSKRLCEVDREYSALQAEYEKIEKPQTPSTPPSPARTVDVDKLREDYESMRRSADRHSEIRRAFTRSGGLRMEAERLEHLHERCKKVVKQLLLESSKGFEARVQKYLPIGDRFGVQLIDGAREVARVGLWRDNALHTALSGGEWARVLAAISCALSEGAELAVISLDDRSFAPSTLRDVCDALAKAPGQVLIATTTVPAGLQVSDDGWVEGDLPGWTIVQTAELR